MAYLSDDELLDTEGASSDGTMGQALGRGKTLEQALAEERLAELENELEQTSIPSTMKRSWKTRKKKPPRSAKSG